MTGTPSGSHDPEPGRPHPARRFEVDTDRLRAAASRLTGLRDRLAPPATRPIGAPPPGDTDPTGTGLADTDPTETDPTDKELAGTGLAGTGLAGWSCEAVLARLDADWAAAVDGLAAGYADHADQLRAAAARYEDAERIVGRALREAAGPC